MDAKKLFRFSKIRRLSKDETIAVYKRHMLAQSERAENAEKHSREASQMFVSANEHITELLQQESFMERSLVAQREDIERLANRVLTAEARVTELETELGAHKLMLKDERRWRAEAEAEIARLRGLLTEWETSIATERMRDANHELRAALVEVQYQCAQNYPQNAAAIARAALTEPAQEKQP
jgi:chromosome segregation ATPase